MLPSALHGTAPHHAVSELVAGLQGSPSKSWGEVMVVFLGQTFTNQTGQRENTRARYHEILCFYMFFVHEFVVSVSHSLDHWLMPKPSEMLLRFFVTEGAGWLRAQMGHRSCLWPCGFPTDQGCVDGHLRGLLLQVFKRLPSSRQIFLPRNTSEVEATLRSAKANIAI